MPPKKRAGDAESNGSTKKPRTDEVNSEGSDVEDDTETGDATVGDGTKDVENSGTEKPSENEETEGSVSYKIEAPMLSGELLFCGASNWDLVGRKALPKGMKNLGGPNLWGPNRISALKGIRIRTVVSGCCAAHCVAITSEGTLYSWGRNEKGQLGLGHTDRQDVPQVVDTLDDENIVDAACGRRHTLFLTDQGKVFACGENKMGQLGLGNQSEQVLVPTLINYKGPPIRRIACGGDFSVISDINGNVYSFGCPEYGQLGHNSDGKYFVKSNKLEFQCENSPRVVTVFVEKQRDGQVAPVTDVDVREIACGANHVLVTDSKKRVFSWGFGGYGRLGHADPKDELVPRLIKFFDGPNRGAVSIAAGSTYSLAVSEHGALYFWGLTKMSGEATMYPKLVQDLSGWKIRSIGTSNKSIVVAADESVVSWGPSPCFGELGYGEGGIKSSTVPKEVKPLEDVYVHHVSCGFSHTLLIARVDTDEEKQAIEKLPVYTP
ncbi:protein RCC2 [Aplysia californica]|uniref:Protein RCC2 n=1 Tax=Aplysia californica TaxID=6500 RepID=A0ABM0JC65_APLCA|nr:protein RCC2 [Aplysia californica]